MSDGTVVRELVTLGLRAVQDVFVLRRCGQSTCRALGIQGTELVRFATVVSEAGQDLLGASGLTARLAVEEAGSVRLVVSFSWEGPHRPSPDIVMAADRLLGGCRFTPGEDGGTSTLRLSQDAPQSPLSVEERAQGARIDLDEVDPVDLNEALKLQNRQLLQALQESREHQEELQRLNAELEETNAGVLALYSELAKELEETNSGVVALYAELEDKSRQLRLASESKTRFWANVSHELRSPVNSVISLARLLLDPSADALTDEQRQQVSLIAASGSTLLALVEELLDVAKAESGRLEPHLVETDLRTLLHQLRGSLSGTAQPGVRLDIPDVDPDIRLVTDDVMLTRVLRNILSNALKFTVEGSVSLDVASEDRDGADWFVLTVQDTGVGVPEDQQDRIFEEFYQVRGQHQRGQAGTGLGLPYARRLTELLGGRLRLDSVLGEGTCVTIELPAHLQVPQSPPGGGVPAHQAAEPDAPVLRSLVIVDDDETFLTSVRSVLQRLAETVIEITDSSTAVRAIQRERPDAILLDLAMAPPDGYQILQRLAADPMIATIPVAVLTSADHATVDRTRLTHARALLSKTHVSASRLVSVLAIPEKERGISQGPPRADRAHQDPSTNESSR
ncbi:ATP-binding response regulator [Streptomyces minutiscleroticus]|uniref:histidine kinase n=1 Tax=Streptomyces minutiscleroticus TaxID=68238 RepID=A0A918NRA8_9ACTN|nr:ATP-binding protein [Streptomyces minutiscleroticus]GGX89669.1 hypothetical protein GCM10010358_49530 [Streptomyces minutiscleroticus]